MQALVIDISSVSSLQPLRHLVNLQTLSLSKAGGINSLEPLKELTNLQALALLGGSAITSLEPLRGLPQSCNFLISRLPRTSPR